MMKYNVILALDPSGSFYEGKGTTGYCIYDTRTHKFINCGSLFAKNYQCAEAYWNAVLRLIQHTKSIYPKTIVVCEDYLLYANKLKDQINSRMETSKLIGCIQHTCFIKNIPYYMQTASEVKKRWSNEILEYKQFIVKKGRGYIPTSGDITTYTHHTLDAIRHAIHYAYFRNK